MEKERKKTIEPEKQQHKQVLIKNTFNEWMIKSTFPNNSEFTQENNNNKNKIKHFV